MAVRATRRRGFTLVELLVVIGIIAVMVGILLPSLRRAREQASGVKCMSNMRQIAAAILSYAQESRGLLPARAGGGAALLRPGDPRSSYDWIAWQRVIDPITGRRNTTNADQNITYSATARYMGQKLVDHNPTNATSDDVYRAANAVAPTFEQVYRCPSDPLEARQKTGPDISARQYRYSYAMNNFADRNASGKVSRLAAIRNSAERILLIDEDEKQIDDGLFNPNPAAYASNQSTEMLAARHESRIRKSKNNFNNEINENGLGNVAFLDGHVERMSRKDALRQKFTGNVTPDPQGY